MRCSTARRRAQANRVARIEDRSDRLRRDDDLSVRIVAQRIDLPEHDLPADVDGRAAEEE
jgi:hypothetical protein